MLFGWMGHFARGGGWAEAVIYLYLSIFTTLRRYVNIYAAHSKRAEYWSNDGACTSMTVMLSRYRDDASASAKRGEGTLMLLCVVLMSGSRRCFISWFLLHDQCGRYLSHRACGSLRAVMLPWTGSCFSYSNPQVMQTGSWEEAASLFCSARFIAV